MLFKYLRLLAGGILLISFFTVSACSILGNQHPMKTYSSIEIPDGEFLHYGDYTNGAKAFDFYQVTKKIPNGNGGFYYRLYFNMVSVSGEKLNENYINWPVITLFDPSKGITLEAIVTLNTNYWKNWEKFGFSGLVSSYYKLDQDNKFVEYSANSIKDDVTNTAKYRINVKPGFPVLDMFSMSQYAGRFFDPASHGIIYLIIPTFIKEPLAMTFNYEKKENLTVKAGTFHINKVHISMGDQFIGRLMGTFLNSTSAYVEDSERRIVIKKIFLNEEVVLEEISNVK